MDDLGVVLAILEGSIARPALLRHLETQGHTWKTQEAWSPREAHRLHVMVIGMLSAEAYAHDLRDRLPQPQGWFSLVVVLSGEVDVVIRKAWGVSL